MNNPQFIKELLHHSSILKNNQLNATPLRIPIFKFRDSINARSHLPSATHVWLSARSNLIVKIKFVVLS